MNPLRNSFPEQHGAKAHQEREPQQELRFNFAVVVFVPLCCLQYGSRPGGPANEDARESTQASKWLNPF